MAKKEARLSPKARKLLEVARSRFSTAPEKAVEYLMSVKPSELTMYDRQKIGREIITRANEGDFDNQFEFKIREDYQIAEGVYKGQRKRSKETYNSEKIYRDGTEGRIQRMNRLKHPAEHDFKMGKMFEDQEDYYFAELSYLGAAKEYISAKKYDKAVECYNLALSTLEKSNDDREKLLIRDDFGNRFELIRELEELKKGIGKKHGLEKTVATTAIVSIIASIFFLSNNITGNAIGNLNQTSSNFIGAGLLIIGLVCGFFWIKRK